MAGAGAKPFVDTKITQRRVMLFSKTHSPECARVKEILSGFKMDPQTYEVAEIECRQDCNQIENYFQIICLTDRREVRSHLCRYFPIFHLFAFRVFRIPLFAYGFLFAFRC
jgi:hypothetical protein